MQVKDADRLSSADVLATGTFPLPQEWRQLSLANLTLELNTSWPVDASVATPFPPSLPVDPPNFPAQTKFPDESNFATKPSVPPFV